MGWNQKLSLKKKGLNHTLRQVHGQLSRQKLEANSQVGKGKMVCWEANTCLSLAEACFI